MMNSDISSQYLAWAKLNSDAQFNLATSGVIAYPIAELPIRIEDIEIGGTWPYGHKPLMERLAAKTGVSEDCLVYTIGTSMANYIALTALVHRGDEVLVEKPTYGPLLTILNHLDAKVERFERRADHGFRLGLGELERRITPKTRLIILCNLHNPSSSLADENTIRQVGEMAAKVGARVLVDEVYLETLFDTPWRSAFHLGTNFIVTSSLTKAYGLVGFDVDGSWPNPTWSRRCGRSLISPMESPPIRLSASEWLPSTISIASVTGLASCSTPIAQWSMNFLQRTLSSYANRISSARRYFLV